MKFLIILIVATLAAFLYVRANRNIKPTEKEIANDRLKAIAAALEVTTKTTINERIVDAEKKSIDEMNPMIKHWIIAASAVILPLIIVAFSGSKLYVIGLIVAALAVVGLVFLQIMKMEHRKQFLATTTLAAVIGIAATCCKAGKFDIAAIYSGGEKIAGSMLATFLAPILVVGICGLIKYLAVNGKIDKIIEKPEDDLEEVLERLYDEGKLDRRFIDGRDNLYDLEAAMRWLQATGDLEELLGSEDTPEDDDLKEIIHSYVGGNRFDKIQAESVKNLIPIVILLFALIVIAVTTIAVITKMKGGAL